MSSAHSFSQLPLQVNCLTLSWDQQDLRLLLQQTAPGEKFGWTLPAAGVKNGQALDAALQKMLVGHTGVERFHFQQAQTHLSQTPPAKGRTVEVSYFALMHWEYGAQQLPRQAVNSLEWVPLDDLPGLAPWQNKLLDQIRKQLRNVIRYEPLAFELLPPKFSLSQLQAVYEALLGYRLDKRNFRKKVQTVDLVEELNEFEENVPYRAAQLFRFAPHKFYHRPGRGFHLKL